MKTTMKLTNQNIMAAIPKANQNAYGISRKGLVVSVRPYVGSTNALKPSELVSLLNAAGFSATAKGSVVTVCERGTV